MRNAKFCTLHFEICNWTERGFSLLELLVVLLLLAISSTLVLPSIDKGLKAREVKMSALRLAAVARDLRGRAVTEGAPQYLVLDLSDNSYQVPGGDKVILPSDVRITGSRGSEPAGEGLERFLFFPNGSILGGEIAVSGPEGSAYAIRFEPLTGKIIVARQSRE